MIALAILCAAAAAYQLLALYAVVRQALRRCPAEPSDLPPVSILKPMRTADSVGPALQSHMAIDYPNYEILLGVDQVKGIARTLPPQFRAVPCRDTAPNAKVAKLQTLAREARHPVLVINDADIVVPPSYLRVLVSELSDVGLVTCLYRAEGASFATRLEALGIATDFAPSALVAPLTGVREFGLGSTLALTAETLRRAGGFEAIRDYIADDYQLGKRVSALGLPVRLSCLPVSTFLGNGSLAAVWKHQVRWARTIRLSRGAYFGLPITFATMWAMTATAAGWWTVAGTLLVLRLVVGITCGVAVLRDPITARFWWLMPLRDLFGVAVWIAGAFGRTVEWSGRQLQLDRDGKITS